MTTILIPVDGSAYAKQATLAAIALGQQLKHCQLHVLTVVTPLTEHMSKYLTASKIAAFYEEERTHAMQDITPLLQDSGLDYEVVWKAGAVASCIVDYAKENNIDHIVMGTRGLGAVSAMLLGSVANTVLGLTTIPVTFVKLPNSTPHQTLDFLGRTSDT